MCCPAFPTVITCNLPCFGVLTHLGYLRAETDVPLKIETNGIFSEVIKHLRMHREIRIARRHRKIRDLGETPRRCRTSLLHYTTAFAVVGVCPNSADRLTTFEHHDLQSFGK